MKNIYLLSKTVIHSDYSMDFSIVKFIFLNGFFILTILSQNYSIEASGLSHRKDSNSDVKYFYCSKDC